MKTIFKDFNLSKQHYRLPKYRQLVNYLLKEIENGNFQIGEQLPSITETSEEFDFSRDTVNRAYSELQSMGVITSVLRKGYFISGNNSQKKLKVLFLFGKITDYNKAIINSFIKYIRTNVMVDIFTYNYKSENFSEVINTHLGRYHYYVIMPQFLDKNEENLKCLNKIAGERLIFLEKPAQLLRNKYSSIFCNFEKEMDNLMQKNAKYFKKYETLNLVLNEETYSNPELINCLNNFCIEYHYEFKVMNSFQNINVEKGNVYFTVEDIDLIGIIKSAQKQNLELGKQIGLISLNYCHYNEILAGGISYISSKASEIGKLVADLVDVGKQHSLIVSMEMVVRKSL